MLCVLWCTLRELRYWAAEMPLGTCATRSPTTRVNEEGRLQG